MRFKGLDLNLLVAFEAIMESRSVSRAAERVNLSQPAMSNALARLRSFFGDELLIAHNKRMYPTPFAETLLPQVQAALATMEGVVATSRHFDPATSSRTFRVMASDYIATAVLFPIITRLAEVAPGVRIELLLPSQRRIELLDSGGIDLLITLEPYATQALPSDILLEDEYRLVGRIGHPALAAGASREVMLAHDHVLVAIGEERLPSFGDAYLDRIGIQRRVAMTVPSFAMLPWLLQETNWLTLMQGRLFTLMARSFAIAAAPPPVAIPKLVEMAQYHVTRANDPGLRWLIDTIRTRASDPT
ncbi:LysR family transcriptional regulator [Sphingomonas sp. 37zxx]|uniref:LysR family transcriptional regulator n=1 Tax=Sphingomonas sp. 37zxx TaxID=1550073 RepID=UPI00053BF2EE|nr:LysR family transcriptional regulator [Sphingomonas sp. 37zxx]